MDFIIQGLNAPSIGITLLRVSIGVFFLISGYHKLFNKARHKAIVDTMHDEHVFWPAFNCWFVPAVEFFGGMALIIGLLTPLAAWGLTCICVGATCFDGIKRIKGYMPLDKADYLDDVLYLPEVLYAIILLALICMGAGPFSLDRLIMPYV